jgi:hypothetical protein
MAITQISRIQVRHGLEVDLPPNLAVGELGYCTDSKRLFIGNGPSIANTEFSTGSGTNITYTASTRIIASSTGTDATLPLFTATEAGLAPLSGGGTTNFLRADGTWAAPAGGSSTDLAFDPVTGILSSSSGNDATITEFSTTTTELGLVPGSNGDTTSFLRGDATWVTINEAGLGPTWTEPVGGTFNTSNPIEFDGSVVAYKPVTEVAQAYSGDPSFEDPLNILTFNTDLYAFAWSTGATLSAVDEVRLTTANTANMVRSFTLEVDNAGAAAVILWNSGTLPGQIRWPSPGTAPAATDGVDVYTFYTRDGGNSWRGALVYSYDNEGF